MPVFGPVRSRRLGLSLGLDIVPAKYCTCNCVYCESGKTTKLSAAPAPYTTVDEILPELRSRLTDVTPEWLTFSGAGEPTLNSNIGDIIRAIKSEFTIPVCVLTNGMLLHRPEVRKAIMHADRVVPTYSTAKPETFARLMHPHADITHDMHTEGLIRFSREYEGELQIEIMIVKDVNDTMEEMEAVKCVLSDIRYSAVYCNTVYRPPAFDVRPVDDAALAHLSKVFDRG
ncbi:MAG: radical SAM protein [Spirochaetota bacterium]